MFKKIDPKQSFPKLEEKILKFWEENKIFEKSVEKNSSDKSFIFYEGPPTANGKPGLHHVLARAFKDIIPRYKTMKGYRVERKAGWDTHGLPVEIQVEKELGIHTKPEIENIVPGNVRESVIEFNKKCKESVWKYKDLWEKMTRRMAYWVDLENPYITYDNKYIESVWWQFAQIWKTRGKDGKSLVYKGSKVIPYCYRCGTGLSSHEVAQGYQKVKDNSVYVKFKAKQDGKIITDDNTYFLVWTTTPWTLPGNVALAVEKNIDYVIAKRLSEPIISSNYPTENIAKPKSETIIMSKVAYDRFKQTSSRPQEDLRLSDEIVLLKSENLLSLEYEPLYKTNNTDRKAYFVIAGDFVSTEEGTGIVHIAPAFGEDDARVGKENDLPTLLTVDEEGKISADVPGKGIPVKKKNDKNRYEVDDLIIEDLKNRKEGSLIFKEDIVEHDYPHCWRCDMPLIYYAKPSWFIRMSELADDLVRNNEEINWIPEYIKEGRFGEWLFNVKDWAISRERYWGTPLPIWECDRCEELKVIESAVELAELSGQKLDDLHKPYIDDVKLGCSCGGQMKRTLEVIDVWFDSGAMPLAQFHYPSGVTKEDREKIESGKFFPADYISEAIDQTRGWFYTLHAIATLLHKSGKVATGHAFKNVICLGHILDAKGKKMSKSKGNVIEPMEVMDEFGADMLRWMLYTINQPGLPKRFDVKGMKDIMNRVFRMLWNSYYFFVMYANIDKFQPISDNNRTKSNLLDKWIISELQMLVQEVNGRLERYDIYNAAKPLESFIDNLSNWYIRRSRKRFWKSENDVDKKEAYETLHYVLVTLAKLMAPFTPFVSEEIYRNLTGKESVHLADYPEASKELIDEKLNNQMAKVREIISEALQQRAKEKIKVRQPLSELLIKEELEKEFIEIIKEEVNVKSVSIVKEQSIEARALINTKITEELRLEGVAKEIIRHIQEMRKEAGYEVDNRIMIGYNGWADVFEHPELGDMIARETLAEGILKGTMSDADLTKEFMIESKEVVISIKR